MEKPPPDNHDPEMGRLATNRYGQVERNRKTNALNDPLAHRDASKKILWNRV